MDSPYVPKIVRTQNAYSLSIEELACRQVGFNARDSITSGIAYARKGAHHDGKMIARSRILTYFNRRNWPRGLSILTMPGLHWEFERRLLGLREGNNWRQRTQPARSTHITAVELDPSIYRAATLEIPRKPEAAIVNYTKVPMWASHVTGSDAITRFYNCDVYSIMQNGFWEFGAAWLDFTGVIAPQKMEIISKFYQDRIAQILIVTFLTARYDEETKVDMEDGTRLSWLQRYLPGEVLHCFKYQDGTSPMIQYAVQKKSSARLIEPRYIPS